MKRNWYCAEHKYGTDGPKPWGLHKKEHHNGMDPCKPAKKMPEEPVGEDAVDKAIGLLEGERERLVVELEAEKLRTQEEIMRLDAALKILKEKQPKPVEA